MREVREGVWRVDVEVRRDPVTGHRRRLSRTILGTKVDAELALARMKLADHEHRLVGTATNARSVDAVLQQYRSAVDSGAIEMSPSTVRTVRTACKKIASTVLPDGRTFGKIPLSRLGWQEVESLYSGMKMSGTGADWIRRCATVLSRSLELARKRGLIETNPTKDATRPKSTRTKPYSPTSSEVRALLKLVGESDPEVGDAATILASTGMRVGELLGLRWEDVNLDLTEVHVAAAVTDGGPGVGIVRKSTKRSDWRDVPLTPSAVHVLRRQAQRWEVTFEDRSGLAGGVGADSLGYVFTMSGDPTKPMRPDHLAGRWAAARGNSRVTLLHLRHFAATAMLDAGESYRTVADILGNSENTLRLHYDGRTDVGKRKAVEALEFGVG